MTTGFVCLRNVKSHQRTLHRAQLSAAARIQKHESQNEGDQNRRFRLLGAGPAEFRDSSFPRSGYSVGGSATALFGESLGPVTSPGGLSTDPRSSPGGQSVLSADKTN